MGNAALKCCRCRARKVSVVLLSGEIAEFNEPLRASIVMKKYPQHIVLHCCMASVCGIGQRRKITVMKPEQALKSNQKYLMTPIETAGTSKPFLNSWTFFSLSANKLNAKISDKIQRTGPKKKRSWIQRAFDKIFTSPRSFHILDDEDTLVSPLLGFNQPLVESRTSSAIFRTGDHPLTVYRSRDWTMFTTYARLG